LSRGQAKIASVVTLDLLAGLDKHPRDSYN